MVRICALVLTLGVLTLLPASGAAAYAPADGPVFNRPIGSDGERWKILNYVERSIAHTPPGATILIATYLMDRGSTVDRLVAAHRRGVNVHVVLDGQINTGASRRLARTLGRDRTKRSFAISCDNSCRGTHGDMHAKFYAFSRTGSARDVVMVSSANLNRGAALLGWNDLFTMTGKAALFELYAKVHAEMARDQAVRPAAARYVVRTIGRFEHRFLPMPGATRASDPIYQALSRVRCSGVSGGAGLGGRTAINVAMFYWSGERGMYLARKLLSLQSSGCDINIIYGAPSSEVSALLRHAAWQGRIDLYDSRRDRNYDGTVDLRVHSKYLLINGNYGGDSSSWQVFTGSANWAPGALTGGDELILRVNSRPAYARYMDNFADVRVYGARKIGY